MRQHCGRISSPHFFPGWGGLLQDFHAAIGATILHPVTTKNPGLQERLIKVVLSDTRLGDPRLPRNTKNWLRIQEARQRFLQWLSRADINFFFEHVLPRGKDPHGRKAFWLRYVPRVLMSRPLLNRDDEARLRVTTAISAGTDRSFWPYPRCRLAPFCSISAPWLLSSSVRRAMPVISTRNQAVIKSLADFWSPEVFTVWGLKRRALAVEDHCA